MSILDRARADTKSIITDTSGFAQIIHVKSPDGSVDVQVRGRANKHHNAINLDGLSVNSLVASATLSESDLVAAGVPVRNTSGQVAMMRYRISFADSTGVMGDYSVKEQFPDRSLGIIVFQLAYFNA